MSGLEVALHKYLLNRCLKLLWFPPLWAYFPGVLNPLLLPKEITPLKLSWEQQSYVTSSNLVLIKKVYSVKNEISIIILTIRLWRYTGPSVK